VRSAPAPKAGRVKPICALTIAFWLAAAVGVAQSNPKAVFIAAVENALEARNAAVREADDEYTRVAGALETAGARLGADARRRLEQGALADARRGLDVAVQDADADWMRRIEGAVRDYEPAGEVWAAVKAAVAALRTELGVFRAVLEAADFAINEAATTVSAVSQTVAGSAHNLAALEATAASAEAEFRAADRAYQDILRRRPQEVEAEGFGVDRFGAFAQGLAARLAGDEAAAEAAERAGEDAFRARLDAIADADAANEAAAAQYDAVVAAARAERDATASVYRDAAAAVRRASQGTASATAERDRAARGQAASLSARRVAFVDAAKSVRVYEAAEMQALQRTLAAAALSAITEVEEAALAGVSREAARRAIYGSLDSYAESRRTALAALENDLQADYESAIEVATAAKAALDAARGHSATVVAKASTAIDRIHSRTYLPKVSAADGEFEDSLVASMTLPEPVLTWQKYPSEVRSAAAADHTEAMVVAIASRNEAVATAFPALGVHRLADSLDSPTVSDFFDYTRGATPSQLAHAVKRYRSARSAADAEFKAALLAALKTDTTALNARVRDSRAAAEAALHARDTVLGAGEHLVAFDEEAADLVRALEAGVRRELLAAVETGREKETEGAR